MIRPRRTRPSPASGPPALANGGSHRRRPGRASTSSSSSTTPGTSSRSSPRRRPSPPARRRSGSPGPTTASPTRTRSPATRRSRSSVPTSGRFGGMYVQAISAYAPHPNAAKLWMEYLYSDEGQNIWLKGYCNPIRYDDMVARPWTDPGRPSAKLPDTTGAVLPTLAQIKAATKAITDGLADHRRRRRQVGPTVRRRTRVPAVTDTALPVERPGRATGASWASSFQPGPGSGCVPFLALRDAVPAHPDELPRRRQLHQDSARASSRSRTTRT